MTLQYSNVFRNLFLLLLSLGFNSLLSGQHAQPSFFHYTTENGLPSSECYEILQDQKGYIWISTDNGVSRFDGYEFKNYGTEEGLIDKTVFKLQEDHRGWIWMSTFAGNFYIHRGDTIAPYAYNDRLQNIRSKYYLIDNFNVKENGTLEIILQGYAYAKITEDGEVILALPDCVEYDFFSIHYEKSTNSPLYISYDLIEKSKEEEEAQAVLYNSNVFRITLLQAEEEPTVYHFRANHQDRPKQQGGERTSSYPLPQGIVIQHLDSIYYLPEPGEAAYTTGHSPDYINCIYYDKQEVIYVGYNLLGGLKIFNTVQELLNNAPAAHLLEGYTVSHVFKDHWGGLWVTTIESGVFYAPAPENFTIKVNPQQTGGLLSRISSSEDQGVFVVQSSGHVFTFDEHLQIRPHSFLDNMNSISDLLVSPQLPILSASPLRYWHDNSWKIFKTYFTTKKTWMGLSINRLAPSHTYGYFWGLHGARGLYKFAYTDQVLDISQFYPLPGSNKITALAEETPEKVWIGALDGLFQLAGTEAPLTAITGHPIYQERVEDICSLPGGGIAVATRGSGLYLLRGDSLTIWSENEGLSANTISHVYVKGDMLWAVSSKGINRIPLQEGIEKNYIFSKKDGIPDEEMSDLVFLGEYMYVLSQYHITKVNQNQTIQSFSPPVYIHDIMLNGRAVDFRKLQSLNWEERNIQLAYHLLDYSQNGKIDYRFRLKPEDQWVYTKNNTLDLLNLNPDEYLLEIQARDKSGQWVACEPLSISISPPFSQTIWFLILIIFIVLLIGYAIFTRRMKELAQEKERIALQEQVSQLKQQAYRAQMNPHFIFNCLSTIQGMIIGEETEQDKAIRMVASFSQLIRLALEFSGEETVTLKDELNLLRNYLTLEQLRFNNNFSFQINIDPAIEQEWVQVPPMLIQPFAENAVLHGMEQKNGDGEIIIAYTLAGKNLRVSIEDNGPGISATKAEKAKFDSKYKHKSLGMTITQRRLNILNQNKYELLVEEPRTPDGQITGTRVVVFIPLT